MRLSAKTAEELFREQAELAVVGGVDANWDLRVLELSRLCEEGVSSTHIAFLGTSMLAKAVDARADLFAIKPTHADGNEWAYSARSLCHSVLVPLAFELGVNIGVTGREPLNNQPYFRMTRLGDGTPVHPGGRAAFNYMVGLVTELNAMTTEGPAREALRAFILVRRRYAVRYQAGNGPLTVSPETLAQRIEQLVAENSEHGRRAQAVVAGLFDVFAGPERIESGRINDPSRHYPGDVCVRAADGSWEKAVEVRDKPVKASDVYIFGGKCREKGVREAAIVMASPVQPQLDDVALAQWASSIGIGLTLFYGWRAVVDQALFWGAVPKPDAVAIAVQRIEARLIGVEASPQAVSLWQELVTA